MSGSLADRTVLVTRPRPQAEELSALLRRRGARVVEAPTIRLEPPPPGGPLDGAVADAAAGGFAWVVFTSAAGVAAWAERAAAVGADGPRARVAAVGSGTAEALRRTGISADLVPERFTTEALAAAFPEGTGRVLLPRADLAAADLEDGIRRRGWDPVRVDAYRTAFEQALPGEARRALDEGRVDAVTFTSASTVEGFRRLAGAVRGPAVVCIGPVTAQAAREAGFEVDAMADPHTVEGLVEAVARALEGRPGPGGD
ncbi:MAG TPA: uroporphyrinogen-III synthase [Actinomycetota bacterium]|nr:uroporphyrinogen-III synthase [Actinomycetota bacterium]